MPERDDAMTLERACEVIRRNYHNGQNDWRVIGDKYVGFHLYSPSLIGTKTEFEAVAIAQRLEREAAVPPSRDDLGRAAYEACVMGPSDAPYDMVLFDRHDETYRERWRLAADAVVAAYKSTQRGAIPAQSAAPPQGAAECDAVKPSRRVPSREWLERAGDIEDATRSVSVGGLAVDAGMYGVAASLAQEAKDRAAARRPQAPSKAYALGFANGLRDGCPGPDRFWEHAPDFQHGFDAARAIKDELPAAEARPQVGEATRRVLEALWACVRCRGGGLSPVAVCEWSDESHSRLVDAQVPGEDVAAALRECGMDSTSNAPSEAAPCSTPLRSTVVPPDQATWDILCAYLAGEEFHGSDISEGRLTEILGHRLGWGRLEVRTAWSDAVERGNALVEADHERIRPIREAEAARLLAEAERRRGGSEPTGSGSSSGSN